MPNTIRTESELLELFADNNRGNISAQDLRDFVKSCRIEGREPFEASKCVITDEDGQLYTSDVDAQALIYLEGAESNIQEQLDDKLETADLATVATTGDYDDLTGKPSLATVATTGDYDDLTGKPTLGTAAALNVGTGNNEIVQLTASGKLPAVSGEDLTNLPSGTPGTDTLTSAASVNLDFGTGNNAKLTLGHDVTFTTSNRAADKIKTLTIFGHASNAYNLTYPGDWKNCGGTSFPASIPSGSVHQFRFSVFGTAETDVVVEYVNGAGVDYALTASAPISIPKGGSQSLSAAASSITGGLNRGYCLISISVSAGTFTITYGPGTIITSTIDGDTGRYTAVQFFCQYGSGNMTTFLSGLTWYGPLSAMTPIPGSGAFSFSISDTVESIGWNVGVTAYGSDEVQQLDWTNTGTPTAPTSGFFTLSHSSYGTTAAIDTQGGSSSIQSALTTLMGSAAPTVGGSGATYTFTFSNGALAHIDTAEMTVNTGSPQPNDGIYNAGFAFSKVQTGDGSSQPDSYNGTWENFAVGSVTFDGVVVAKNASGGSGASPVIGGVTYTLVDSGGSFTLTASDFADHGTISATPSIGFQLTGTMTTTTAGGT